MASILPEVDPIMAANNSNSYDTTTMADITDNPPIDKMAPIGAEVRNDILLQNFGKLPSRDNTYSKRELPMIPALNVE